MNYLIIGLGNPGPKYSNTRHNVGFLFLDKLAEKYSVSFKKLKFHMVEVCEFKIGGDNYILAKPQTFMNLSGKVIPVLKRKYFVKDENIFVAVDNADLPAGRLRIREGGSDAGHNGLKSISMFASRAKYKKIFIGVSGAKAGEDLADYVLARPKQEEAKQIEGALDFLIANINEKSFSDLEGFMHLVNSYRG